MLYNVVQVPGGKSPQSLWKTCWGMRKTLHSGGEVRGELGEKRWTFVENLWNRWKAGSVFHIFWWKTGGLGDSLGELRHQLCVQHTHRGLAAELV